MVQDREWTASNLLRSFRRSVGDVPSPSPRGPPGLSDYSLIHMSDEQALQYYLKKELAEARTMIKKLEEKCEGAQSYREKSSKLLEEALRALGRLEQAMTRKCCEDLIVSASELKACVQQGLTLINVYGKHGAFVKMATLVMRKSIYSKYDQVTTKLNGLVRPSAPGGSSVSVTAQRSMTPQHTPQHNSVASDLASQGNPPLARASPAPGPGPLAGPSKLGASQLGVRESQLAPSSEGVVIRNARHDKVHAMASVPSHLTNNYANIWWSAGNMLEYYTEANGSTTTYTVDKDTHVVTALGLDDQGNIWTGHIKGLLRVRPRFNWDHTMTAEDKTFSSQIKCIAFDEQGLGWVGDQDGKVKVFRYQGAYCISPGSRPSSQGGNKLSMDDGVCHRARLELVATLQHSLLTKVAEGAKSMLPGMWQKLGGRPPCQASRANGDRASPNAKELMSQGPIRAMLAREGRVWIGGGQTHCSLWLALVDGTSYTDVDVFDCRMVGAVNAMAAINWTRSQSLSPAGSALPRGVPMERELSTNSRQLAPLTWRLITGHETGQLMLWHPRSDRLAPLIRIGEPMSPLRGIHVSEDLSIVITGHQNGELHMFVQQRLDAMLPPGSESSNPDSLGTVRPKKLIIKAHKSNLVALMSGTHYFCTASSQGTIRFWPIADIAADVARAGLMTWGSATSSSLGSMVTATALSAPTAPTCVASGSGAMTNAMSAVVPSSMVPSTVVPSTISGVSHMHHSSHSTLPSDTLPQLPSTTSSGAMPAHLGLPHAASTGGMAAPSSASTGTPSHVPRTHSETEQVDGAMTGRQASATAVPGSQPTSGSSIGVTAAKVRRHSSVGFGDAASAATTESAASSLQPTPTFSISQGCQTIDQTELTLRRVIGQGAYGKVWLAEWTGCAVAVKELLGFGSTPDDSKLWQEMQNEVHLLGTYNHPNIMRFMAVCLSPPMIVMQYYPHGSLFDLLTRARNNNARAIKELAWTKRLDMMRDVAAGMHYLHTRKPPVIHGDLRSPNLLLDLTIDRERPRFHVKIADFGLARMLGPSSSLIMVSKTTNPRWTAPEVIKSSQIGPLGDVYSFAIIMWEVLTWQQPYEDMMSVQVILRTVQDQDRPLIPPDHMLPGSPGVTLQEYKTLMQRCWAANAEDRPTFKQIVDVFQTMRDTEARAARSSSGAPRAGSGGSTGATPVAHAPSAEPVSPATHIGAPSTPASSRGSVKSDTAAMLIMQAANGPAKDSASSIMGNDVRNKGLGGPQLSAGAQLGGSTPPPVGAGGGSTGDAGSQRSSAAVTPRGNMFGTMSPIVEERSLSLTHEVAQAHALALASQGAGNSQTATFSPFANENVSFPPAPANNTDIYRKMPSFVNAPVNLLDGDDGSDPLEAYRSGALEEFGYSRSMIFGTNPSFVVANTNSPTPGNNPGRALSKLVEADEDDADAAACSGMFWQDGGLGQSRTTSGAGSAGSPLHGAALTSPSGRVTAALASPAGRTAAPAASPASPQWPLPSHPSGGRPGFAEAEVQPEPLALGSRFAATASYPGPDTESRTSPLQKLALPEGPAPWLEDTSPVGSPRAAIGRHRPSRSYDHAELSNIMQDTVVVGTGPRSRTPATALGPAVPPRPAAIGGSGHLQPHGHASTAHPSRLGMPHQPSPLSPTGGRTSAAHIPATDRKQSDTGTRRTSHPSQQNTRRGSNSNTPSGSRHNSPQRTSSGNTEGGPSSAQKARTSANKPVPSPAPRSSAGMQAARGQGSNAWGMPANTRLQRPSSVTERTAPHLAIPQKQRSGEAPPSPASSTSSMRGSRASSPALKSALSADNKANNKRPLPRSSSNLGLDKAEGSSPRQTHRDASPRMVALNNQAARQGSWKGSTAHGSQIPNAPGKRMSGGGSGGYSAAAQAAAAAGKAPRAPAGAAKPAARTAAAAAAAAAADALDEGLRLYAPLSQYSPFSQTQQPAASTFKAMAPAGPSQAAAAPVTAAVAAGGKIYAPLSALSPFSQAQQQGGASASSNRDSSAEAVAAATAPVYAPLSKFSPFAAAQAAEPDHQQGAAQQQQQEANGGASRNTSSQPGQQKVYAPLTPYSPFSAAQVQAPSPAAQTTSPQQGSSSASQPAKYYAPLNAYSPFAQPEQQGGPIAAPAMQQQQQQQSVVAQQQPAGSSTSQVKYYAPLSGFSPFAQPELQTSDASGTAATASAATPAAPASTSTAATSPEPVKYFSPLSHYSPFHAAQKLSEPEALSAPESESARSTALHPPSGGGTAAVTAAASVPQGGGHSITHDGEKVYAPLSAHSPFSGAAFQSGW